MRATGTQMFRSLRHRNARWFFAGLSISIVGTWVQMTAMSVLIYRLTGRSTDVGISLLAQFLPMLLLGAWAGGVADRHNKRRMTLVTQSALALQAVALGIFELVGTISLTGLYLFSLLLGVIGAIDNPARRAFVIELVEADDISNVVALNTAVMTGSRIFGPAIAAVLLNVVAPGWLFLFNGITYLCVLVPVLLIDQSALHVLPPAEHTGQPVREALRFVAGHRVLGPLTLLYTVIATFAFNYTVSFVKITDVRWNSPDSFGWIMALGGVGSLAGALYVATLAKPTTRLFMTAGVALGVIGVVVAWAPTVAVGLVLNIPLGAAGAILISAYNGIVQMEAPPEMRGRLLALGAVAFLGSTPVGAPLTGWIGDRISAEWSLAYGSVIAIVAVVAVARRFRLHSPPIPRAEDIAAPA